MGAAGHRLVTGQNPAPSFEIVDYRDLEALTGMW
jgi:hypothetical protein